MMGDLMEESRLQILVSAVNKDARNLPEIMNIESDAVIVDQIIGDTNGLDAFYTQDSDTEMDHNGSCVQILVRHEKGVGLSRNTAFEHSDREIIQFADDDIVYDKGYVAKVLKEFDAHPEADMLLFNVKAQEGRETYWNTDFAKVSWKNYGRYPAYAIFSRRAKLEEAGVKYSLLFGGGAPYMNGEDSLFLHDCLAAGLSIYRTSVAVGHETKGESTWFKGYTDKFFFDRGVLYHFLYGKLAILLGFRFLFNNRKTMCSEMGLFKCFKKLVAGVKHGKTLKKV